MQVKCSHKKKKNLARNCRSSDENYVRHIRNGRRLREVERIYFYPKRYHMVHWTKIV